MTQQQGMSFLQRRRIGFAFIAFTVGSLLAACGGGGGGGGGQSFTAQNACVTTGSGQTLNGRLPGSGSYTAGGTAPSKGGVTIDTAGNFTYIPRAGLRGMDTFSYRVSNGGQSAEAVVTVLIGGAVRIMPLGDSITSGVSGDGTAGNVPLQQQVSYRRKLFNDLENLSASYSIDFVGSQNAEGSAANPPLPDRDHEGHPGWCDDSNPACTVSGGQTLDDRITSLLDSNPPDIILLHIGTNHPSPDASGMNSILNKISAWAGLNYPVSVLLARIIPSVDGSVPANAFNDNVQAIAGSRAGARVVIVDQQTALASAGDANRANPAWMADNLHPNQAGYDRMADRWRASLTASGVLPQCP